MSTDQLINDWKKLANILRGLAWLGKMIAVATIIFGIQFLLFDRGSSSIDTILPAYLVILGLIFVVFVALSLSYLCTFAAIKLYFSEDIRMRRERLKND